MLRRRLVRVALVVLVFSTIAQVGPDGPSANAGFGELLTMVEQNGIARVDLDGRDHTLTAVTTAGKKHASDYPQDDGTELVKTLRAHDVAFTAEGTTRSALPSVLTYALPFVIFIGIWILLMRQMQGGGAKLPSLGKAAAGRTAPDAPELGFRDVAGVDEAVEELHERPDREAAGPRLHPPRVPELPSPLTPTARGETRSSGPGRHS